MANIELIPLDFALLEAIARGPSAAEPTYRIRIANVLDWSTEVARQTAPLYERAPREWPWGAYLALDRTEAGGTSPSPPLRQVVGTCAFKAAPDPAGVVEIAYFTYPPFERRGFATAMAGELIAIARTHPASPQVIAHTLPERNASTRVLEKNALRFAGEVIDPEDGRVWRWILDRTVLSLPPLPSVH